jgi:hypothetical protein
VRGLSSNVEKSVKDLDDLEKRIDLEKEKEEVHRKEFKEDIRLAFKTDIAQSASDICHGFELFAVEIRSDLKKLGEGLDARNATVNRLGKQVDYLTGEMIGIAKQLQNQGIPIHYRSNNNRPPSNHPSYHDQDKD